ncbi:hypothetical protein H5410_021958 [Solanum commersonii]|uniref:NB-ARC domain-containing protein n=1 Tax=Solanum commersonii TaxID=4109 RepID=A0A9J5ZE07_SOLCO|nr:hypothetical protein H5410_021958 [Solanum commersonii]
MEDDFNAILEHLIAQTDDLAIATIFGMCNIGETSLAKKVYDDYICSQFDKHAWFTIFEEYNERQMLLEVVSTITGSNQEMSNDQLMKIITEAWDQMQRIFPNNDNRKLGKHIVLQCRGLPLSIVVIVGLLGFPEDKEINVSKLIRNNKRYSKTDVLQLKLLNLLDVFSIEYDFSCVIPQLVHLRYVSTRIEKSTYHNSLKRNGQG